MKIGILGGTFDPIHNGHIMIAQYAMEQYSLDKVLFMTSSIPPHKESKSVGADMRHKMVCAAVEGYKGFYPFDYEVKKGGVSYTVDTLRALSEEFKNCEIYFIIGGDSIRDFDKWRCPEEIVKYCTLLVYPRMGIDIEEKARLIREKYSAEVKLINSPEMGISSTEIRERIENNKPVNFFIPERVSQLIKKEKLYV